MNKYLILLSLLSQSAGAAKSNIKVLGWKKLATHSHDPQAFTQGLVYWEPDILGESVGQYGQSQVRRFRISTGKIESEVALDKNYFGEGLARIGSDFFQLTWQERKVFVWNWDKKKQFTKVKEWDLDGEGWGLTTDNKHLFVSNGTANITVIDPKTFKKIRTIHVKLAGKEQTDLNELEWIDGKIFANVWRSSMVFRIDPESGEVDGILDFHELTPAKITDKSPEAVLNGLAWNPKKRRLYVTGKLWPVLYEIKIDGY